MLLSVCVCLLSLFCVDVCLINVVQFKCLFVVVVVDVDVAVAVCIVICNG